MLLDDLLAGVARATDPVVDPAPALDLVGDGAVDVRAVVHDTRAVAAGALYCCVPGRRVDGHDLAGDAVAAGAVALLVERPVEAGVPEVRTPSVRAAMGPVAASLWGHPARSLPVVGVTGTSGKTTTTHLLASVLERHGWSTALVGTLSGARTTPEAPELQALLGAERDAGRAAVVMEVSSHALAQHRVRGTRFAVAVFTNLSRDHLDFHRDLDDYFAAKASLFTPALADRAVVNLDDPRGRELAERALVPTTGFSLADAEDLVVAADRCAFGWRGHPVALALGGRFNAANAVAAAAAAEALGVAPEVVAAGLSAAPAVPGRFEPVDEGQPFAVLVDYAHKPDALAQALTTAREAAGDGQVVVVFGAGGDRDPSKRPEMGEVAARLADRIVLTSDNPRGEDPLAIIAAIRGGMQGATRPDGQVTAEPDRRAAIAAAVGAARPGDVVVIAGKGHETTQVTGTGAVDFDDRQVAREALRARRRAPGEEPGWSRS